MHSDFYKPENLLSYTHESSARGYRFARCHACRMQVHVCICELIPRIQTTSRLTFILHVQEYSKSTNTGILAHRALSQSQILVHGVKNQVANFSLLEPDENHATAVFFPTCDAIPLDEFYKNAAKPIHLIIPDGSWKQAKKLVKRVPPLRDITAVKLPFRQDSQFKIRRPHHVEGGLATIEATAHALGIIEGQTAKMKLLEIFRIMVERTLFTRGKMKSDEVFGPRW